MAGSIPTRLKPRYRWHEKGHWYWSKFFWDWYEGGWEKKGFPFIIK